MRQIVISNDFGGFSISEKLAEMLNFKGNLYIDNSDFGIISNNEFEYRSHPKLLMSINAIGPEASSGKFANIVIVEIPDDVVWTIEEWDGREWVSEAHRTWG